LEKNMKKINLFGSTFQHDICSTHNQVSSYVQWEYNVFNNPETFYVDYAIVQGCNDTRSKIRYGWMLESNFVTTGLLEWCHENHSTLKGVYRHIFTYHKDLIQIDPDLFKFCPAMGSWIKDPVITSKTKLASMICSKKAVTAGHIVRLSYAEKFKDKLDLYGRGFNEIKDKEEGLQDYMFSVAIENGVCSSYFTEKVLDCFALGVVPVYLGSPDIGDYFNIDGIIQLTEESDISDLSRELYESKLEAIKDNFKRMQQYKIPEDWLFKKYFEGGLCRVKLWPNEDRQR
jgi:hypothetical protein